MASTREIAPLNLMNLPSEVRNMIYLIIFPQPLSIFPQEVFGPTIAREDLPFQRQLLQVNRQIHDEAAPVAYRDIYCHYPSEAVDFGFRGTAYAQFVKKICIDNFVLGGHLDAWFKGFQNLHRCTLIVRTLEHQHRGYREICVPMLNNALLHAQYLLSYPNHGQPFILPFQLILVYPARLSFPGQRDRDCNGPVIIPRHTQKSGLFPSAYRFGRTAFVVNYQTGIAGKGPGEIHALATRLLGEQQDGEEAAFLEYRDKQPEWVREIMHAKIKNLKDNPTQEQIEIERAVKAADI